MKKEEPDSKKPTRKLKFAPKAPPPKIAKPLVPKTEPVEIKDETIDKALMDKLRTAKNDPGLGRRNPKKKEAQISFGEINSLKSFNIPKFSYSDPSAEVEKEYVEPWNYESNYPITLPLRPPYSGDPEILNEDEFRDANTNLFSAGTLLNPASELGLTEEREDSQMLFFQLPSMLPLARINSDASSSSRNSKKEGCKLNELSGGYMGKLLVYKSGKVKMKLGDNLFDVYPGSDCKFAQDVMAVNTKEKQCCVIGQLGTRAIVAPDVDSMLNSIVDLEV